MNITWLDFTILALATYRISSLLSEETGPFRMFSQLRVWMGEKTNAEGDRYGTNVISKALVCLWCVSVWVGIGLVFLYYIYPTVVWYMLPLALSAVAVIIESRIE
jgi:hypothetical protein